MPVFIAALLGGLIQAAGSIVGRVLIALGIGFVSYQGLSALLDGVQQQVFSNLDALSPDILNILGILQVDRGIKVIFSAIAARLVLNGLGSGTFKKMVFK